MSRKHRADRPKWWKVILNFFAGLIAFLFFFYCFSGIINAFVNVSRNRYAKNFVKVDYGTQQLKPVLDDDGCYTFTTDGDFKIMQLTDVHIGGGYWSGGKDKKALNAVATMITAEKPDLVVVTGDLAYPVPFQTGTLNNKASAKSFATMMEKLGVYWTIGFGNHDTEAYSYFTREKIYEFYTSGKYPHCLLTDQNCYTVNGEEKCEVAGVGNQIIKIKKGNGIVNHAIFVMDSHSYGESDPLGIKWGYDCIKQNQVDWYSYNVNKINSANLAELPSAEMFKSTVYFHIPLQEFRTAYTDLKNGGINTLLNDGNNENLPEDISYFKGTFGENPDKDMIYNSEIVNYHDGEVVNGITVTGDQTDLLFETMVQLNSTKGVFCGHDHLNNSIVTYKGINLVYGMSIDYLAYFNISSYGRQRGCTIIDVNGTDGDISIKQKNYYENYNAPEKETKKQNMRLFYEN